MLSRRAAVVTTALTTSLTIIVASVVMQSAGAVAPQLVEVDGTEFKVAMTDGLSCARLNWPQQH